jgi:hypothetical protein
MPSKNGNGRSGAKASVNSFIQPRMLASKLAVDPCRYFADNLYWLASAYCSTKRSYLCGAGVLHFAPISAISGLWRRLGSFFAEIRRMGKIVRHQLAKSPAPL